MSLLFTKPLPSKVSVITKPPLRELNEFELNLHLLMKRVSLLSSRHGPVVSPQGVVCVKEDAALTTHVLLVRPGPAHTRRAVHGGGVSPALRLRVPPQPDVAVLAPEVAPAVPDDPVSTIRVGAIAHELDSVVHGDVGVIVAAVIDTALIASPATEMFRCYTY